MSMALQAGRLAGMLAAGSLALASPAAAQPDAPLESELPRPIPNYHILTDTPRKGTPEQNFRMTLTLAGEGSTLWSGDLVLAEYNGARIETDIQDTNPACPASAREIATRRSAVIAELVPIDLVEGYEFKVYAHWSRRDPACTAAGQKVSQIDLRVSLAPGETRVLEGDGGLVVRVTRQR